MPDHVFERIGDAKEVRLDSVQERRSLSGLFLEVSRVVEAPDAPFKVLFDA